MSLIYFFTLQGIKFVVIYIRVIKSEKWGMKQETFGDLLSRALKEKNLTPQTLARELEIAHEQVYRWLRGESVPPFLVMSRVMEITGKGVAYFFDSEAEQKPIAEDCVGLLRLYKRNKWE